ncbi:precorrin-6y C5,15-methyltransferase (decarboxylating) subunit CbiE [Anaerosalibacter sp. Marseille-P3206]|uniref:precorrin-6y C5,15-methyltransferase (decarboxylating) subunit CbiE n=1 Tax=Anaerosalibacter sp. Marseille-P3206 TaxID=1871005 RepID=UPI001F3C3A38|nr:precorrin-6y C5,15-methyltransferase (decarboxylating) subunit CbiE [Anaerosalibacter sp. Marseille-P3206]
MITVAGIGPGNPKYLTVEVREEIEKAKCVLAFGRVGETLKDIRNDFIIVKRVEEVYKYSLKNSDLLILASGDPCFYGIVEYLKVKNINVDEVLPGISSFQYMMGKLKKSWHGGKFMSFHGRTGNLEEVLESKLTIMLTDSENTPSVLSKGLHEVGVRGNMYIGYNLSYEDEKIIKISVGEEVEDYSSLAVVVVENEVG